MKTSRDRPKSAPYPRLKNSKKTSKCQVLSFTVLENRKNYILKKFGLEKKFTVLEKITYSKNGPSNAPGLASASPWRAKVLQCRKTQRGTLWDFSTSILTQNSKKIEGGPFGEKIFRKKNLTVPEKNERGTLWSRPVWYVTRNTEKPFWFSSLGQIVQFSAIIFCRTFKNYFGQFVWIENKPGPAQVGAISKAQK